MTRRTAPTPMRDLRAVILVGGKGTRLFPYTATFPKPLVPIGERPILELLIRRLAIAGVHDVVLALGHHGELVQAYLGQRDDLLSDVDLSYVKEREPLGTAGALALVPGLGDTFLMLNGDVLTDIDLSALVAHHRQSGSTLTIGVHRRRVKFDLGILQLDGHERVIGYVEKPEQTYDVSMGVYVMEPSALEHVEPGVYLDFPDLVHRLLQHGEPVGAFVTDCLWLDIGRPDDYATAQELYEFDPDAFLS
jgi:NDP-sugar pyrophosphorylase family protein